MYAPSIIGHEEIKKAIILQAVGGVEKFVNETHIRGNIHILLIGDPGTAKSQLLMWNKNAVQKSIYVADASGAGLIISFTKNNDKMAWETGALILGNEGVVAIDEFEKMREESIWKKIKDFLVNFLIAIILIAIAWYFVGTWTIPIIIAMFIGTYF